MLIYSNRGDINFFFFFENFTFKANLNVLIMWQGEKARTSFEPQTPGYQSCTLTIRPKPSTLLTRSWGNLKQPLTTVTVFFFYLYTSTLYLRCVLHPAQITLASLTLPPPGFGSALGFFPRFLPTGEFFLATPTVVSLVLGNNRATVGFTFRVHCRPKRQQR